ncbi:MAG: hypothetical protein ABI779_22740 [Acidobacteriota bacterium]
MFDPKWIPIVATLLGGGAAGALITLLVTSYRNRRQPVGFRKDLLPVFRQTVSDQRFSATVRIDAGDRTLEFDNLSLATIELVNRGNRDLSSFSVGFTLAKGDAALFAECGTPDRHHAALIADAPTPMLAKQQLDYVLTPFNREDRYTFKFYIYTPPGREPGEISIGSREPVFFKPMPTLVELAAAAARGRSVDVGPFGITFFKK